MKFRTIIGLLLVLDIVVIAQDILFKLMFYQHIPYFTPLVTLMKLRLDTYQDMWLDPLVIGFNAVFIFLYLVIKPEKQGGS